MTNTTPDQDMTLVPSFSPPKILSSSKKKRLRDFATIKVLSQNANGLKLIKKLEILSSHLISRSIQIMCLQETWLEKQFQIEIPSINDKSCMFFHHGPDSQTGRGSGGVGILLNPEGIEAWKLAGSQPPDYLPII
mmetsp:Transcript_21646/g.30332  ORF Transcript_21646/g.30332 Transcript_21646/m.30332 type:complete len:135 (+) Transcript_21646:394-798(+)